ncbi:MAG: 50S ribosomal protein L13 [Candidatus Woesebacteria bacterium GW2011_GWA1_39_21b]|uniref:50S ribosomal protein L13 n=3 Tax=Patescibacteria group TaxID=1783273 RepID=A0A1G2QFG5_9BACT|nr:MAG: 50S ribosomal protein L13 [Candidatus Woesebacteria bacterium GW2011_GWA1_39_21b]KKS77201.1 MAG: 50S ribosomal protein L13 [Parcubacteria group bacterium GW2011_GWB1_42_9]KKS89774.1 MAG: 50S ribosomal protein L13 [Parcubacteria group bacterium GW2011_GWC1_43_11b]OHA59344.1 MAG: 50S ribosomal protein L13 [Candidatus Vogelbacteria bacterium RIFOXYB1_FULL_42_16]OHA60271.1 MAG: 50S ribosomal protein L13 [Candidatus Vogelbacteria bacterium RIFOXYD1_FULL_42_15]
MKKETKTTKEKIVKTKKVKPVVVVQTFTIDATDQAIGRVASRAAMLLRGKNSASFTPHLKPTNKVQIENASKLKISEKKAVQKTYFRHSHQPGGDKYPTLSQVATKKGYREVLRHAIHGMLPANRLRAIMMTNLKINE